MSRRRGSGVRGLRSRPEAERGAAVFHPSGKGQDGGGGKTDKTLADFAAEYAKSNRSTCKGCMEKIEKVSPEEGVWRRADMGALGASAALAVKRHVTISQARNS